MKQQVRVIKTQRDYAASLARLSALMDQKFAHGSNQENELELLALVIEAYERSKVSPVILDPVEAIRFRMDQQKLAPKDLVPLLGSISKVSEILARKRQLSLAMIRALHKGLGIPAEVLISASAESNLDISVQPQYNFSKFPLLEMLERGCFVDYKGGAKRIKDYAEEEVRKFMRGVLTQKTPAALLRAPLHQNSSRKMDEYALIVWRICVLKKARAQKISAKYREGFLTEDWLRDVVKLSRFDSGPQLAQEYLADAGIALVIEPHFKRTYLDGAAMLDDGKPVVALTLRHDRIDNFWFALLHELVHVQKHLSATHMFIADDLEDKTRSGREENDADSGARELLIPAAEWKKAKVRTTHALGDALALANRLRIHPAIVAGRVRYETANWRLLSTLVGAAGEVSRNF